MPSNDPFRRSGDSGEGRSGDGRSAGDEIHYVREAFKSQYNWIGIAGASAFALVTGSAFPLLLAAGLELMYLAIIPQNPRWQRLIRSRRYEKEKRAAAEQFKAMVMQLPSDMRARYAALQDTCTAIRRNYAQLSSTSRIFSGQMEERLGGLLQGFLRLLVSAQQHREYLNVTSPDTIQGEIAQLRDGAETEPVKVAEINRHRIEILEKRLEKFHKIAENHQVIEAQCAALQDVLALIRDQSVTMKDPQQVSDQLGNLVKDLEQTEEAVREVESIFAMATPEMNFGAGGLDVLEPVNDRTSKSGEADRSSQSRSTARRPVK